MNGLTTQSLEGEGFGVSSAERLGWGGCSLPDKIFAEAMWIPHMKDQFPHLAHLLPEQK